MIRKVIIIQKESKVKYLIKRLKAKGIYKGPNKEILDSMDYFSLIRLLAVQKAVES